LSSAKSTSVRVAFSGPARSTVMLVSDSGLSNETETFCPPGLVAVNELAGMDGDVVSTMT